MADATREAYNASKRYKTVLYIKGRDAQDFSLNEMQALQDAERQSLGDAIFKEGAVLSGLDVSIPAGDNLTLSDGAAWLFGRAEAVPGGIIAFPHATSGVQTLYARWTLDQITSADDATLVNPFTNEQVDERFRTTIALVAANPDAMDGQFEDWLPDGTAPRNWAIPAGTVQKGYPSKFGRISLQMNVTAGLETRAERTVFLLPSTSYTVYFWVRTADGQVDLSLSHGANVSLARTSPAFGTTPFVFATGKDFTRKSFTFTSDGDSNPVTFKIQLPVTCPTTKVLVDAVLVTTSGLVGLQKDRHHVPLFLWDRASNAVTRAVSRASNIRMSDLEPPLDGRDIVNVQLNRELLNLLAGTVFDEHGHFRVPPGLLVERYAATDDSTHLGLRIQPGRAYVRGYRVSKPNGTIIAMDKAVTTAHVNLEGHGFVLGTNIYPLNKTLGSPTFPISQVTDVEATVEQVVSITRGVVADGTDSLGVTNVVSIQGVSQGVAGALTGTVATSFVFTATTNKFTLTVANYDGTAGAAQSIFFARGTYTIAEVLQALNTCSGRAYRSGKITGNVVFTNDGTGKIVVSTKTKSNLSVVTIGTDNANAAVGFTNGQTNTGTGTKYTQTTDWVQAGNSIAWTPTGGGTAEPGSGTTYTVVLRKTKALVAATDYTLGGTLAAATYFFKVTALGPNGEGLASTAASLAVGANSMILISWPAVTNAESYHVYVSTDAGVTYNLLQNVTAVSLESDGSRTPDSSKHPSTLTTNTGGVLAGGEASVLVGSTTGYAAAGSAFIEGTDIFAYTSVDATHFLGCTGVAAHASGVAVTAGPTMSAITVALDNAGQIDLNPQGSDPVDGTTFQVSYDYYQPRIDVIGIDSTGGIAVVKGEPSDLPLPPAFPSDDMMALAQVRAGANSTTATISNFLRIDRPTVSEVRTIGDRVDDIFENDVKQQIINEVDKRNTTTKKGIFADALASQRFQDRTHPLYALSIDTGFRVASVPFTYALPTLTVNAGPTTAVALTEDRQIPSTETLLINQDQWSETRYVNEFAVFVPPPAGVTLTPNKMSWSFQGGAAFADESQAAAVINGISPNLHGGPASDPGGAAPPWITEDGRRVIIENARVQLLKLLISEGQNSGLLMQAITVRVDGRDFVNLEDNIKGVFAGVAVNFTPISPTVAGTLAGSVKANDKGRFAAKFTIPVATAIGIHDLVVSGATSITKSTFNGLVTILPPPPPPPPYGGGDAGGNNGNNSAPSGDPGSDGTGTAGTDPLAQSLSDNVFNRTISAVSVYFDTKDPGSIPVTVQLRGMINGYPNGRVYVSKALLPSDITLGVETKVDFDRYVRIPAGVEVAITLLSASNKYSIQTATLAKLGKNPAKPITSNPYAPGVLFTSSNQSTWTPVQESDFRMKVYGRVFSASAVLEFTSVGSVSFSDLFLGADQDIPTGTKITWEYELNGDGVIRTFNPFSKVRCDVLATAVILRARLSTTDTNISPVISMPTVGLVGFLNLLAGKYVSADVQPGVGLATCHVYVPLSLPGGTTATVLVSNDNGATWVTATLNTTTPLDAKWANYGYSATFVNSALMDFRVRIDLTATTPLIIPEIGPLGATLE